MSRSELDMFSFDSNQFSQFMPKVSIRSELDMFSFDSNQFS